MLLNLFKIKNILCIIKCYWTIKFDIGFIIIKLYHLLGLIITRDVLYYVSIACRSEHIYGGF